MKTPLDRFFFWVFLVAIFSMIIGLAANADTLQGNKDACKDLGMLVVQAGDMRDAGVSWDIVQTRLKEMIEEARKNPESYVQTEAESAFVLAAVRRLWSFPDKPGFTVAAEVFKFCMDGRSPASHRSKQL